MNDLAATRLRSYRSPRHDLIHCSIWEAGRATTAAPLFFEPITFRTSTHSTFADGGMRNNNPINEIVNEAEIIFKDRMIRCIVSLGTGGPGRTSLGSGLKQLGQGPGDLVTDASTTADNFYKQRKDLRPVYFRFNVDRGMEGLLLHEYKEIGRMDEVTRAYLERESVHEELQRCIPHLVELKPLIFHPELFLRVWEHDDTNCKIVDFSPESQEFGIYQLGSLIGKKIWHWRADSVDVNLRYTAHNVPRGWYQDRWYFGYVFNSGQDWLQQRQLQFNCTAGRPRDPALFTARATQRNTTNIPGNLNNVFETRSTETLTIPIIDAAPHTSVAPHQIFLPAGGSQKAGPLIATAPLQVGENGIVGFPIKRIGRTKDEKQQGRIIFFGVEIRP